MFFFTENILQFQTNFLSPTTTTTSTTFVDLLSMTINSYDGSYLYIDFSASGTVSTDSNGLRFQLLVNGVAVRGCACGGNRSAGGNPGFCTGLVYKTDQLHAGNQTITIQWCVAAAGTGTIDPITNILHSPQHGSLIVIESLA